MDVKPAGWHSVTPRIVVEDAAGLVEFLREAFGASGELRDDAPAILRIGDSIVMISGAGPRAATPAFLYLYVDDADAAYARALRAGARSLEEPGDMPYGDRRAMVQDHWGNVWQLASAPDLALRPIGRVRSSLRTLADAPMQGREGAPDAWIDLDAGVVDA